MRVTIRGYANLVDRMKKIEKHVQDETAQLDATEKNEGWRLK